VPQDRAQKPDQGPAPQGGPGRVVPPSTSSGPALPPSNSVSTKGTYFLGRYRVVDEIGIGGMASVHLARMDGPGGFQKWVAIKRIHPHLIEDDSFIHMFLDEARIAARISHPNVATVFELGKHDDTYWIAMEYLHGEPLREVMRKTEETGAPMPPEIACRVIADAAEGLHAAHELLGKNGEKLNLIHRDVTPHNLFVTYEGTTKVVDFGIAKFSSRMSSTRAGTLKGKLAYMSPEQVAGETIDRRTDIFALGVVLWELTTGQRLFRMDSDLDTLAKVQECNIPRPSSIVRGYPIDLEKIVMKALAKNRGERFKTAREFSRMLQSLLMRRGLFIASDEVASYVQSIFKDRIEKREAHLRWAGEVTQTINVDALQGAAQALAAQGSSHSEVSFRSDHSDVQAAGAPGRQPPRPAAGMPATVPESPPVSRQSGRLAAPPLAAPPMQKRSVPSDYEMDDGDDAPTLQATVAQVRAARDALAASAPAASYGGGSGFGDDFEEVNDTIVEDRPTEEEPSTARPAQAPLPAAGRPAQAAQAPRHSQSEHPTVARPQPAYDPRAAGQGGGYPQYAGGPRTLPLNTTSPVGPRGVYAQLTKATPSAPLMPRALGSHGVLPLNISDPSLPAQTLALGGGPSFGAPLPVPAQSEGELPPGAPPAGGRVLAPTARLFVSPSGQTQTAHVRGNKAPWWAVAILGATAVFVLTGAIFLLVSLFSSPKPAVATGNASPTTPVPTATAAPAPTQPAPTSSAGAGPFVSARSAFLAAIVQPTSASPPPPPAPAPAPTTSPATTAAASDTSEAPAAQPQNANPPDPTPTVAVQVPTPTLPTPQPATPTQGGRHTTSVSTNAAGGSQGFLTVVCLPGCDQIYDNGKLLGPSPVFKRATQVGSHKIKLVLNNPLATKTVSAIVQADQVFMVRESMP
jgi:eukaryotic-like serine/threonine-protein kinase